MTKLVRAPARKAGDPGSNPGPSENFSVKLTRIGMFSSANNSISLTSPSKGVISAPIGVRV